MHFSWIKVIEHVLGFLAIIGFLMVVGAVGTQDYADEVGIIVPWTETLKLSGIGFVLMIPLVIFETQVYQEGE